MTEHDLLRRFIFEDIGVRGLWVNLTKSWQTTRQNQQCPLNVQLQLGQAVTAAVLLSATIKFDGSLILQAQGNGALKTLVAQTTHDRKIRGLIRNSGEINSTSLEAMFGNGRLVLTIDNGTRQPYQGIVPLAGENLASAIEHYFSQSEQLNTRIWLFADENRAAGLLLQELPAELNSREDWTRLTLLADTITEQELLGLDCESLLHRLFHEESVRVFSGESVTFECSCTVAKIENALRLMGQIELENILLERGDIEVNCEFCNKHYRFDRIDVEQLFLWNKNMPSDATIRH
jgi:molecular chaperone Hsp33